MDLPESIRAARHRLKLAQRPFAERAGVGQNLVVRAEKGGDIRLSTLRKLAKAGGLEPVLVPYAILPVVHALLVAHERGGEIEPVLDGPMYTAGETDESEFVP